MCMQNPLATCSFSLAEFALDIAAQTGITLDPCYTCKAAYGMVQELKKNPSQFKGNRILFLHTGNI